jgi:heme O synthase-like polyprenyltransferase
MRAASALHGLRGVGKTTLGAVYAVSAEPLLLFLIIFFWTPPYFWALSLYRADDYVRASVPMLPVVAGRTKTQHQILVYTLLLVLVSILPWAVGFVGVIYGASAILAGAKLIRLAWQLRAGDKNGERAAKRLFAFSIPYLFLLFAIFLADKQLTAHFASEPASQAGGESIMASLNANMVLMTPSSELMH